MLRTCSRDEFEKYADFAYELATDLTKSGYPTYCDGVKTKGMFLERSRGAFASETEQLLLFEHAGEVQGLLHSYFIPDDHYLSTVSFNVNTATEVALSEFLTFARERFRGYDLFLGFPAENSAAVHFLAGHGFVCIEDDYNHVAFLDRCGEAPRTEGLIQIGRDNYERFRKLHLQAEGDMYWNSERIFSDLARWVILLNEQDGEPSGAVYYTDSDDGWFEIFGIDLSHGEHHPKRLFKQLLGAALSDAKRRGGRGMIFFCDEEYKKAAAECGFTCVGNYRCYQLHLE